MRISVLGAGAWGTAMAAAAARDGSHDVRLWARDAALAARIAAEHRNPRYLGGVDLPPALGTEADLPTALAHASGGLVIVATPMAALREMLHALPREAGVLWLCKGLEAAGGALGHEIAAAERPDLRCGVLSGPSFAIEVARGQPTALVAASSDAALAQQAVEALHGDGLRIYTSDDVVGVEIGGAVKNVIAIAAGIVDGLPQPGLNARAALITRGLAEITRLGLAMGARAETFMGLSGLGDLVLTCTGELSRNHRAGRELARGRPLAEVLAALGHVAEGVLCAPAVRARALRLGVEMPITEAVVQVLEGRLPPELALAGLMNRQARAEGL